MAPVPEGFPYRLDDTALETALVEMTDPAAWPGFERFEVILPELKIALLAAGLNERARREAARSSARGLRIAYLALAVAGATLIATIIILIA